MQNGIAAVQTRIRTGALRILAGACPNLLHEAGLYRWDDTPEDHRSETPADGYDHALDALRYLVSRLDERGGPGTKKREEEKPVTWQAVWNKKLMWDNEEAWRTL